MKLHPNTFTVSHENVNFFYSNNRFMNTGCSGECSGLAAGAPPDRCNWRNTK
jgi:hypothetical protein